MNNFDEVKNTEYTPAVEAEQAGLLPPLNPCQDKVTVNEKFTVETRIEVENIDAFCFGDAVVKPFVPFPPYPSTCKLVICQDVKVKIPIKISTALTADRKDIACDQKHGCDGQHPC